MQLFPTNNVQVNNNQSCAVRKRWRVFVDRANGSSVFACVCTSVCLSVCVCGGVRLSSLQWTCRTQYLAPDQPLPSPHPLPPLPYTLCGIKSHSSTAFMSDSTEDRRRGGRQRVTADTFFWGLDAPGEVFVHVTSRPDARTAISLQQSSLPFPRINLTSLGFHVSETAQLSPRPFSNFVFLFFSFSWCVWNPNRFFFLCIKVRKTTKVKIERLR